MAATQVPAGGLDALSAERLRTLVQVSQQFNGTLDVSALLPRILDLTLQVVDAETGSLWLLEGERVRCTLARGALAGALTGAELALDEGIVGLVARTREAVLVTDAREETRLAELAGTTLDIRSVITVPLLAQGECLGVLQLINEAGGDDEFDEADVAFVLALADDAAAALRNARLLEAERRARDLRSLLEVSHEITSSFQLERVLISVVNLAGRAVPFDRAAIALWDDGVLRVRAISGEESVDEKAVAVRDLASFLLWGAEKREALYLPDLSDATEPAAQQARRSYAHFLDGQGVQALLLLPIRDGEGDMGVLYFESRRTHFLERWNREAAQLLTDQAALAIRNAQLYANVPFISWLEPIAEKRRALAALPASSWLRYGGLALAIVLALVFIKLPMRVAAEDAVVRSAVQRAARAGAGGVLEEVWVRDGEQVAAGQPIARLRNTELASRINEAEAELRLAERALMSAEARGDLAAATNARVLRAQLEESVSLLRLEGALTQVLAPEAGVVLTPRLDERVGSWHDAGEAVAWIGRVDEAELELKVQQRDVGVIAVNDRVRLRVSAHPGRRLQGNVTAIAPLAQPGTEGPLFTVRARVDNAGGLLRPGMEARARVLTQPQPLGELIFRRPWRWIRMHLWL
ncbi:MAG TPA: GAF domain-containing protein [Longimicrobiales bacterium]|nr:GAF domain-containing protein [Longimicrobiales bacterium]